MRLHDPWALGLVVLVPLLLWVQRRTRRDAALRYPSLGLLRAIPYAGVRRWRWLLHALGAGSPLLLVVALARPQKSKAPSAHHVEGLGIVTAGRLLRSIPFADFLR